MKIHWWKINVFLLMARRNEARRLYERSTAVAFIHLPTAERLKAEADALVEKWDLL